MPQGEQEPPRGGPGEARGPGDVGERLPTAGRAEGADDRQPPLERLDV